MERKLFTIITINVNKGDNNVVNNNTLTIQQNISCQNNSLIVIYCYVITRSMNKNDNNVVDNNLINNAVIHM